MYYIYCFQIEISQFNIKLENKYIFVFNFFLLYNTLIIFSF